MLRWILCLFSFFSCYAAFEKTNYVFDYDPIDVIIPCHEKDVRTLELCIEGIQKHGKDIRRIIVISSKPLSKKAEWFDESLFPFSKKTILKELGKNTDRVGWIYQQLLKLYAVFVIPNISPNVLALDADTVFLKDTTFVSKDHKPLFTTGKEHHEPYFAHAKRLLPQFEKVFLDKSGIVHHMLFQKPVLEDLFFQIRKIHNKEPFLAILQCIDLDEIEGASFSEYEIYFNFIFGRGSGAKIRPLRWKNSSSIHKLPKYRKRAFDYVSFHEYKRDVRNEGL